MGDGWAAGITRGERTGYRGGDFNRVAAQAIAAFSAPGNVAALRAWLQANTPAAAPGVETAAESWRMTRAREVLEGGAPLGDAAAAARRLNRAFIGERLAVTPDPSGASQEQYARRMFTADSLRPPGLERLNAEGPLYGARFDETEDAPWDAAGDPRATAADRLGDYYGEDGTMGGEVRSGGISGAGAAPPLFGGVNQYGRREAGGTSEAFRVKGIPFWQKTGAALAGVDWYIGDTLGSGPRELGGQVRGWGTPDRQPNGRFTLKRGPYMV
jgi:hypothetical protein